MQQRLAQFIRESVNDENVNILPDEPRNFNFKFTGNLGPTSLNRQLQLDDTIKEKQNRENEYINFSIDQIEQQQMRKYGMSRLRQKRLNYTNKINALRLTNAKYNERINILQPTGQETALPRQRSDIGAPLKQIEMASDKSEINELLKLLGDNKDEVLKLLRNNKDKPTTKTQEMKQIVNKLKRNEPKSEEVVQERADQKTIEFINLIDEELENPTQEQLDEKYSGGGQGTYMPIGQVEQPSFPELSEEKEAESKVPEMPIEEEKEAESKAPEMTIQEAKKANAEAKAKLDRINRLNQLMPVNKIGANVIKRRYDSVKHYRNIAQKIKDKDQTFNQFEDDLRTFVKSIKYRSQDSRAKTIGNLETYIDGVRNQYETYIDGVREQYYDILKEAVKKAKASKAV